MQVLTKEQATKVERSAPESYDAWKWPEPVLAGASNMEGLGIEPWWKTRSGDPLDLAFVVRVFETLYEAGYVLAKTDPKAAFAEGFRSWTGGNPTPIEFAVAEAETEAFEAGAAVGRQLFSDGTLASLLIDGGVAKVEDRLAAEFAAWAHEQRATVG